MISMLAAPTRAQVPQPSAQNDARLLALQGVALMLVFLLPALVLQQLDPRTLNDISVWVKPTKFALSLTLHFATLAWAVGLLAPEWRHGIYMRRSFLLALGAGIFEMAYISLQAARGRASHFNHATPTESILYAVMGVGAVLLVAVSFDLGWRILKSPRPGLGLGVRLGAGIGLTLGSAATLVTAGLLGSGAVPLALGYPEGHWVGGSLSDAGGLPLLGWSTNGGDLRVPHFFATHIMQALPLLGWLADRWRPHDARRLVWGEAVLLLALVAATLAQAALGYPFLRLS
ncbi:hypothetical protein [Dongia rigui]|uniref:Uncharacterized protein n=1 Tax=Dongia rigui TaxID=940149 RepID=A0ABU5DYQ9_9PROT|nr:hypothetical protein [Dongia rigui]MDY0871696.1 hypothetical protein [Dongia rigui]